MYCLWWHIQVQSNKGFFSAVVLFFPGEKVGDEGEAMLSASSIAPRSVHRYRCRQWEKTRGQQWLNPGPREHARAIRNPYSRGNLSLWVFIAADTFPLQIWSLNTRDTCYHAPKSLFKIPFLKRHVLNA